MSKPRKTLEKKPHGLIGRPSNNRKELTPEILETMAELTAQGLPMEHCAPRLGISIGTFHNWLSARPEFGKAWRAAKEAHGHVIAERIMEEAHSPLHDDPKFAQAEIQRRRLIVNASQWISSKLLPKMYGDTSKVEHSHTGAIALSPLAQLRQLETGDDATTIDVTPKTLELQEDDVI